jgi:hypothetical protein
VARGAAGETPNLSRQRVGDTKCSAEIEEGSYRDAKALHLGSVGPNRFEVLCASGEFRRPASLVVEEFFPEGEIFRRIDFGLLRLSRSSGGEHDANAKETLAS